MISETVGHYRIVRKLGEGGMGQVYLAKDLVLERKVAIKFLTHMDRADSVATLRFLREAKAAAQLDHPFICEVHEVGEHNGAAYIVMEYVSGTSLWERIQQGPLPLRQALKIIQEVSEALEVAHSRGIVHRDLKPANIMLTPQGHAKVMDFGLAKWRDSESLGRSVTGTGVAGDLTTAGTLLGTPAYMSPEQTRGEELDGRSDIFALGIVLQECVTGQHPFRKGTVYETLNSIVRDPPIALRLEGQKTLSELTQIQAKTLAKAPADRYSGIHELTADIRRLQERLIHKEQRRSRWVVSLLILLALGLLGTLWRLGSNRSPAEIPVTQILVSDFDNRTGEEVFDGVLEQSLVIGLESASFIRLLGRNEALEVAQTIQPGSQQLTVDVARLVALRSGISTVTGGEIRAGNGAYDVSLWIVDPSSGERTFEIESSGLPREGVLGEVGEMALRLRRNLGDRTSLSEETIQQETFTAGSLEAAHSYAMAQELLWAARDNEALSQFLKAIELDPDFGRAYSGVAIIYRNLGEHEKALEYFEAALARIDRMTVRERYRTRGNYYVMKGDFKNAATEFQSLVDEFPGDVPGYNNLGVVCFYLRNMPAALEQAKKTLELDPQSVTARYNYAIFNMYAGEFETASTAAERLAGENAEMSDLWVCRALSEAARGNYDLTREAYGRLAQVGPEAASRAEEGLADLLLARGQLNEGVELLQKSLVTDLQSDRTSAAARKMAVQARALVALNEAKKAEAVARRALELSQENRVQYEAAMAFLDSHLEYEAEEIGNRLRADFNPVPGFFGSLILGELRRRQGRPREALNLLNAALELEDHWLGHFHLGLLYLGAQEFALAHSEFERCFQRKGESVSVFLEDLPTFRYFPLVYYYLGTAQEGLKSPAAEQNLKRFSEISGLDTMTADPQELLPFIGWVPLS